MIEVYDGIWACASIIRRFERCFSEKGITINNGGVIYASFKYGEYEGMRNGRCFTDFTELSFKKYTADIASVKIADLWITGDVRQNRGDERWLILQKLDTH